MPETTARPDPTRTKDLHPLRVNCPTCGGRMWADYTDRRPIATPAGLTRLNLRARRCRNAARAAHRGPYRPEAEAAPRRPGTSSAPTSSPSSGAPRTPSTGPSRRSTAASSAAA